MRRFVVGVVLASLALAGCGNSTPSQSAPTTQASSSEVTMAPAPGGSPSARCTTGCSKKEVVDTGCDQGTTSRLIQDTPISWGGVKGLLALVAADDHLCPGVVWARFDPDDTNATPFEVFVIVDGERSKAQPSLEGNPAEVAFTVGIYAEPGTGKMAQPCLSVEGQKDFCLPAVQVVL